ncbi:hypothetical protein, partial [Ureibacillus manganicus]|uniref:hypothetical protein n=1 Tax=Ureibacillus manganicus TaxID=1266064 RepID=UPI00055D5676
RFDEGVAMKMVTLLYYVYSSYKSILRKLFVVRIYVMLEVSNHNKLLRKLDLRDSRGGKPR